MRPPSIVSIIVPALSLVLASAYGLGDGSRPDSKVARNVLEGKSEGYCTPSGPIESTHCLYETVESLNKDLFPTLSSLVKFPFFRHYKVDLYRECPFWYENGFCMNRACGVQEANEEDIPEKWRSEALSAVTVDKDDGVSGCYFREQDYCFIEDDATKDGQYIDLTLNPERFTGYAGDSAQNVWRAIYEENCFGLSEASMDNARAAAAAAPGGWGFSKLSEGWGTEMIKGTRKEDEICEEKKAYYRVISGLHASISIHICHEYLDQTTGEWAPNLQCFINRLATHPERLSNVYFNAVLLLRAVARAAPYLRAYDIGTAPVGRFDEGVKLKREEDVIARNTFDEVLHLAGSDAMAHGFDEGDFFTGVDAPILKEQFKTHFRNVSRIMDCVGCDKCRLWGKLQVSGIGTALKILFELDEKALDPKINPDLLQRSEVVALFNTLHRISESLAAVESFRKMYAETQTAEAEALRRRKEKVKSLPPGQTPRTLPSSVSPSAWFGLLLSALETTRRNCTGCLELCWRSLARGPLAWLRNWVGEVVGKVEL